jgi:type IV pilus assembly protein PilM
MAGRRRSKRREEIIAIDLGTKTTKAVVVARSGEDYSLRNYVLMEAPSAEKAFSRSVWADHVRKVGKALGSTTRRVVLALGPTSAIFSQTELPAASPSDLRKIVKLSPKNYLQQDLPDHVFDCYVTPGEERETGGRMRRKARVLVAAARRPLIEDLVDGAWDAGYVVEQITLSQVATANAFAAANPEEAPSETAAFLDIGFRHSTISILLRGRLALVRVVNIGAEQLADIMQQASTRGPAAGLEEDDNPGLDAMQVSVQKAIRGLAKEVDASIGFFLSQNDVPVHQVYVSGGSARSHLILQTLEMEMGVPCRAWNPALTLKQEGLAASRGGDLEYEAPQLTVAVGAALGFLDPELDGINLLAERAEEAAWRRRDPVRRARWLAGFAVFGMALWAGWLGFQAWRMDAYVREAGEELRMLQEGPNQPLLDSQVTSDLERRTAALGVHAVQRFLVADVLNELQFIDIPKIQLFRFQFERVVNRIEPPRRRARRGGGEEEPAEPTRVTEHFVLRMQGKNYGDESQIGLLFSALESNEQFSRWLDASRPILLTEIIDRQIDPGNPTQTFARFGIECRFKERTFVYE